MTRAWSAFGLLALIVAASPKPARSQVLHTFDGLPDGKTPTGGLVQNSSGALFGVTGLGGSESPNPGGSVYQLSPPAAAGKPWREQVIHSFPASANDGSYPTGDLLIGADGSLYGATGGGHHNGYYGGTIFKLAPPPPGDAQAPWSETILAVFNIANGEFPEGNLIADASGSLYGVTSSGGHNGGVVFKLSPPPVGSSSWTLQTLHFFGSSSADGRSPVGKLAIDAAGNLYGATISGGGFGEGCFGTGCGVVYELSPPAANKSAWTETILYTFNEYTKGTAPAGGLVLGAEGVLYGTAEAGGIGTNCACGVVFALAPPVSPGTAWQYAVINNFDGINGQNPEATLTIDAEGNLYGTTPVGGQRLRNHLYGTGVIFRLVRPRGNNRAWTEIYRTPPTGSNGYNFTADVLIDSSGFLDTTAPYGGPSNFGTVLRLPR